MFRVPTYWHLMGPRGSTGVAPETSRVGDKVYDHCAPPCLLSFTYFGLDGSFYKIVFLREFTIPYGLTLAFQIFLKTFSGEGRGASLSKGKDKARA